jgi:hypothetical protein
MGRLRVRDIFASYRGSRSMLSAFADALHRVVPAVRKTRVKALREGDVVVAGRRSAGTG